MTTKPAIECVNLGKQYFLRDNDANPLKRMTRRLAGQDQSLRQHQALQDVNLTIMPGESVALVGVNGSGKSTLLKLITGITPVTSGELTVNGRVGGIIDLGAGFHPDLTGYENIFLQATLLGLPRKKIWERLEAIQDFCELGRFLNTPIRHYSMGMFLRLAFAIAVHTDPDIFIIDEALAVGDGYFMWKCLKKLEEMKADGKTLLYVSHVPEQVETLCERGIWIHGGRVRADGPLTEITQDYQQFQFAGLLEGDPERERPELSAFIPYSRFGTGLVTMQNVRTCDENGTPKRFFRPGDVLTVEFDAVAKQDVNDVVVHFILERPGRSVTFADSDQEKTLFDFKKGSQRVNIKVPSLCLRPGPYFLTLSIGPVDYTDTRYDGHQKIYTFTISEPGATAAKYSNGFLIQPTQIRQTPKTDILSAP
jgi:ABC-type polysaccharide/polyol phosphate transport system ATPase subunit